MTKLLVFGTLVLVAAIAGLVASNAAMSQYITAIIALIALAVSVLSAFKEDVFPFRPRALFGEIILAGPADNPQSPTILMPIAFINEGYGSGVIEGLTLKVVCDDKTKIYIPVTEVDMPKFLSGKRAIHAENILGVFNSFPIESRGLQAKSIAFVQSPDSKRYPLSNWSAGEYNFRLYMKHSGEREPVEVGTVTRTINAEVLAEYKAGTTSTSISPDRELIV